MSVHTRAPRACMSVGVRECARCFQPGTFQHLPPTHAILRGSATAHQGHSEALRVHGQQVTGADRQHPWGSCRALTQTHGPRAPRAVCASGLTNPLVARAGL